MNTLSITFTTTCFTQSLITHLNKKGKKKLSQFCSSKKSLLETILGYQERILRQKDNNYVPNQIVNTNHISEPIITAPLSQIKVKDKKMRSIFCNKNSVMDPRIVPMAVLTWVFVFFVWICLFCLGKIMFLRQAFTNPNLSSNW